MNKPLLWIVLLAHVACLTLKAELPLARLLSIFPAGGQRGTSVAVKLQGADLDDASGMAFTIAGISAAKKSTNEIPTAGGEFLVTISSNVPAGIYEARAVSRFGLSNPRFFSVVDQPCLAAGSTNRSLESALEIPPECTIHALAPSSAADFYKFQANKDAGVWIEVLGEPYDSKMRPVLVLFDSERHEIARERSRGFLFFRPRAGGSFYVKVHDLLYGGGIDFAYRLTVSSRPRIQFVYPPARTPGTERPFDIYGWNLPAGNPQAEPQISMVGLEKLSVAATVPLTSDVVSSRTSRPDRLASAAVQWFDFRMSEAGSPVPISVATVSASLEKEPNNNTKDRQKISVPCEVQGQFYPAFDSDVFEFAAKKGDVYWIEVFSDRLGEPTSPFILIQKLAAGSSGEAQASDIQEVYAFDASIAGPVFNFSSRDPSWRLEAKEDATYQLQMRDLFNRENDPSKRYRLSIRRETPDFRLVALLAPPPSFEKDKREARVWSELLRQNDCLPVKVVALRRDGFTGAISLRLEGAPDGVAATSSIIPEGQESAWITVTSKGNVPEWNGTVQIMGTAKTGATELVRIARAATVPFEIADYNNEGARARLAADLALAVRPEPAPFRIDGPAEAIQVSATGKTSIALQFSRAAEFKDAVKLRAFVDAQNDPIKEWDVDGQAAQTSFEIDAKGAKLSPGLHQMLVLAQTKGKFRRVRPDEVSVLEASLKAAAGDEAKRKAIEEKLRLHEATAIFAAPIIGMNVTAPQTAAK